MNTSSINFHRFFRGVAAAIALLCIASGNLFAQTSTGTIRGTVSGAGGAPIASAQIAAQNVSSGVQRNALSNDAGAYTLVGLVPGTYVVTVRRIGNAPQTRTIVVQIGATQIQDFALATQAAQLADAGHHRCYRNRDAHLRKRDQRHAGSRSPSFRRRVAISSISRSWRPASPSRKTAPTGKFRTVSAGGQAPSSVNLFIDGTSFKNDLTQGGIAGQDASRGNPFPRNAVQEYRVIAQNFKAEYQKASSAVITATTKSGGNVWSGNALIGYQNASMVQLDTFQRKDKAAAPTTFARPDYNRTLSALSIGGPIVKDKIHFFGSYEGNIQNRANRVNILTPPAGFRRSTR